MNPCRSSFAGPCSKVVERLIGGATAPVTGSGSAPACTASVSILIVGIMRPAAAIEQNSPRLDTLYHQQLRGGPRIRSQACPDGVLTRCVDDKEHFLPRSQGTAQDDEPLCGERIHEGRVLGPKRLLPHRGGGIPGWPPGAPRGER